MRIGEPTTTLTDLVLGLECLYLGRRLWLRGRRRQRAAARWMAAALLITGAGALLGAASHGLRPWIAGSVLEATLWQATLWSLGVTAFLFLGSIARAALSGTPRRLVLGVAVTELAVYLVWTATHHEFLWAILDYVPAMLVALVLAVAMRRRGEPGAGAVILGILLSFAGAGIQASGLAVHRHFNHNDLFHVVQMVAVWFLYRGGCELRDAGESQIGE